MLSAASSAPAASASSGRASESQFDPQTAKRGKEFQITAIALLSISLLFLVAGFTLMGVARMPFMLTKGMTPFFCYFAGVHLTFIGLGVLVSAVVFSTLSALYSDHHCARPCCSTIASP